MRVAIVGASGNVGTALLRILVDDDIVTSVVGVVRRPPPVATRRAPSLPAPYDVATWVRCDVAAPGPDERTIDRLATIFSGADAVVHLAWALQPSHDRTAQRRTNVLGMRRVAAAAVQAGVPHLVVASSVGAYSPAPDDAPRTESWPTTGVRSSAYSADKVAVERLLDDVEQRHPELAVARIRSALVFQRAAGQQLTRNFIGSLVPARLFSTELRTLPWPTGLRLQVVHADDLAAAYREVVVRRHRDAFNVAAADVLSGDDVAALVSGGRRTDVALARARGAVAAGWHARLVPVSPGWLDLAAAVPVLDCTRARELLRWSPLHSSTESVAEMRAAIAQGSGTSSPPLRPRRRTKAQHG